MKMFLGPVYTPSNKHYIPIDHKMNAPIPEFTAEAWFRTSEKGGNFDNWALLDFDRSEYRVSGNTTPINQNATKSDLSLPLRWGAESA